MNAPFANPPEAETHHFDVLIVGAGISGIGSAYHLTRQTPEKTFVILEAKESFGGTWITHKYPGIRSDSDLYTFGYRFKPWVGPPIATAEEILKYVGEVIEDADLGPHIRYGHRITGASWSSAEKVWTVDARRADTGDTVRFKANFLWMCQGYYRHEEGYTPAWPGMADFKGSIIHPQTWPEDPGIAGKRVVLIGSGATAATLIPNIANECAHVTMLQRSPTYFFPGRNADDLADQLRELEVDEAWIHEIVRRRRLKDGDAFTRAAFEQPEAVKAELLAGVRAQLPEGYDVDTHFTPRYRPWRQRIAFVPDGDLFKGIASGKASVVTDEIERFVPEGILLKSGEVIEADVVITATGFNFSVLGDIPFTVDGRLVDFAQTVTWRGMMFTGVPNLVWVFGYFRASWTLRVDIVADLVCRLLKNMDAKHALKVTVELTDDVKDLPHLDWMDSENFSPGYLMRAMHLLPKRLDRPEWQHTQDYWTERKVLPTTDLNGPEFRYEAIEAHADA